MAHALPSAFVLISLALAGCTTSELEDADPSDTVAGKCKTYVGDGADLQAWIDAHACVRLAPGDYSIDAPLFMPESRRLTGDPGQREHTVIRASGSFPLWGDPNYESTMIRTIGGEGPRTISHLWLDGADRAIRGICCKNLTVVDVIVWHMACDGIVLLQDSTVSKSDIGWMALNDECPGAPDGGGGGIYLQVEPGTVGHGNIVISENVVHDNNGMGIDNNGLYYGTIEWNWIYGNAGPAGIGMYEASHWTIFANTVSHAASPPEYYHPSCAGGPIDTRGAALKFCEDGGGRSAVDNYVAQNKLEGPYGILSIGADEIAPFQVPRANTFEGNDVGGSSFGCADDFSPGQWFSDDSSWTGDTCAGPWDTGPAYF